jgi:two-component system, OmpR family, sensor histidine kinase KdpD
MWSMGWRSRVRNAGGYLLAVAGTGAVTLLLLAFRDSVASENVVLGFLIVVVAAAAVGGLGPGITAAGLGFLSFDVLFLRPYNTLAVDDPQDWLSLAVYLLTAVLTSYLFGVLERRRRQAERREAEARALSEERARARALEEADRLRTALLNSVSHDLRTPLASIKASVSSLLDHEVTWEEAQREEFLETIDAETDRLNRLVHNLLGMSRIEAGALKPNLVETSLIEVVGPAARRVLASHRERRVEVDVPDSLPLVRADPVLLEQVLTNLLDNAFRHAASSPVRVAAQPLTGGVALRVIDHGPGIPAAERERVFELFHRLENRTTEGTGMGLAISRGIVRALDGDIRAEGTPGGGATFVVWLPLADHVEPSVGTDQESATPGASAADGGNGAGRRDAPGRRG